MQRSFWFSPAFVVGVVLTLGFVVSALSFFPAQLSQIHKHWVTPDDQDMGYLLLAIGAWFFFSNLPTAKIQPQPLWLLLLAMLALGATAALVLNLTFPLLIYVFAAWAILVGASLGPQARALALRSTALLCMALPMWYLLIPIQKDLTVLVTNQILGLFGLTFHLEGALFTVPTGSLIVADGCAGNKYLQAAVAIALLIWIFGRTSLKQLAVLLIAATVIALVANWLRVSALVMLASWLGVDHAIVQDHDLLGWVIFGVCIAPFIFLNRIDAVNANPETQIVPPQASGKILAASVCVAFGLLFFILPTIAAKSIQEQRSAASIELTLPEQLGEYSKAAGNQANWRPDFTNYSQEYAAVYASAEQQIEAVVLAYRDHASANKLTSWTNSILDREDWNVLASQNITANSSGAMRLLSARGPQGETRAVLYWYGDFQQRRTSFFGAKVLEAKNLLTEDFPNAVYAFSTDCESDCQLETAQLKSFAKTF